MDFNDEMDRDVFPTRSKEDVMGINFKLPEQSPEKLLQPRITVIGIGGAGGNAVNNMIAQEVKGVEFVVANTDAQALTQARTDRRIQLGVQTTEGLGSGAKPNVGRQAADEALDQIAAQLKGSHMIFIAAGMGGGTGTGAAPVIAAQAREMGILTVGVVTKPFQFEGIHRMRLAEEGIEELAEYVDTLIVIPNQNLFRVANEKTTFADAFKMADNVLCQGVRGVTDLMLQPGLINLDFADIKSVMAGMGQAMMGTGESSGESRALDAAEKAIANPLLEDSSMKGAKGVLINITGGPDMTLFEVDEAANRIRDEVDANANIIFGSTFDPSLEGLVRVSVVATGMKKEAAALAPQDSNLLSMAARRPMGPGGSGGIPAPTAYRPSAAPVRPPVATVNTAPAPRQPEVPTVETLVETARTIAGETNVSPRQPEAVVRIAPTPVDSFIPEAPVIPMDSTPSLAVRQVPPSIAALEATEPHHMHAEVWAHHPQSVASAAEPVLQAQPAPQPQPEPERRSRSLLERVGLKRSRPEPESAPVQAPVAVRPVVTPAPVARREPPAVNPVQPTFKFDSGPRTLPERDDEMDIPAFLRRQAN